MMSTTACVAEAKMISKYILMYILFYILVIALALDAVLYNTPTFSKYVSRCYILEQ